MSIASYRACYQLLFNPSYWDKTKHGISKYMHYAKFNKVLKRSVIILRIATAEFGIINWFIIYD